MVCAMRLNMALSCRISVFTDQGKTKIGLIKPAKMLLALSQDAELIEVAREVEKLTILMVTALNVWPCKNKIIAAGAQINALPMGDMGWQ